MKELIYAETTEAVIRACLWRSSPRVGLMINFNVPRLVEGIVRRVL